ncbi:DUF5808 domain-containing protein [Paenibacillus sp. CAU 1782]
MLTFVLLIPAFIIYLGLYFTYRSIAVYKNGLLFSIALPSHALEHPDLKAIQSKYRRTFNKTMLWLLLFFLPIPALYNFFPYQTAYFLFWMSAAMISVTMIYRNTFAVTLALKRREEWFVGERKVIHADLRAAQLKNKTAPSPIWFVIPLAISTGILIWFGSMDAQLYILGIVSVMMTLLFLCIALLLRRSKSTIYSERSETNLALNQMKRRSVSFLLLALALFMNVEQVLVGLLSLNETEALNVIYLPLIILFSLVPLILILTVYRRLSTARNELLQLESSPIYSDDDEYWANGFTYHNPHDKSLLVPKRVGVGETINTGTLAGKLIMGGAVGLLLTIVFGVSVMLIRMELIAPALNLTETHTVEIKYPMYSYSFDLADVKDISLTDIVPKGSKTSGEATNKFLRGHFRLNEVGKARLYLFKNNPPFIKIELADEVIFYNDELPANTEALFKQLTEALEQTR